jgi:hypothetical protein
MGATSSDDHQQHVRFGLHSSPVDGEGDSFSKARHSAKQIGTSGIRKANQLVVDRWWTLGSDSAFAGWHCSWHEPFPLCFLATTFNKFKYFFPIAGASPIRISKTSSTTSLNRHGFALTTQTDGPTRICPTPATMAWPQWQILPCSSISR